MLEIHCFLFSQATRNDTPCKFTPPWNPLAGPWHPCDTQCQGHGTLWRAFSHIRIFFRHFQAEISVYTRIDCSNLKEISFIEVI